MTPTRPTALLIAATPRTVDYTETDTFARCLSTDTTLTSGLSATSITLPGASCTAADVFPDTPYAINWNNGQASQITNSGNGTSHA